MFIRNNEPFDIHALQVIGENQYPAGWFLDDQRRAEAEVFEVYHVPAPAIAANQKLVSSGFELDGQGRWVQRWLIEMKTQDEIESDSAIFSERRAALVKSIDADVDAVYAAVIGNRSDEYNAARDQAAEFAEGGYLGAAPPSVASWAAAKGWTATQAADDILAAAASLAGLRDIIRAQRLAKKEAARAASGEAALAIVSEQWAGALAAIRAAAGL